MFPTHVWPVSRADGIRTPVISNPFKVGSHNGADIVYRIRSDEAPSNLPSTTKSFEMPTGINVLASAAGTIERAYYGEKNGYQVIVNHGSNYRTFYSHLLSLSVKTGEIVKAGQKLGIVGDSPTATDIRHLHFEIWYGSPLVRKDPAYFLKSATYVDQSTTNWLAPLIVVAGIIGAAAYAAWK